MMIPHTWVQQDGLNTGFHRCSKCGVIRTLADGSLLESNSRKSNLVWQVESYEPARWRSPYAYSHSGSHEISASGMFYGIDYIWTHASCHR